MSKPLAEWTDEEICERLKIHDHFAPIVGFHLHAETADALREILRLRAGLQRIALGAKGRREAGDKSEAFDWQIARDLLGEDA